jgi:4-hydroxy-3-methylbut-2-enyl diphosphate reductase
MQATKRVVLAEPRSFCAGVRRAIAIIELALERYGPPVYVRKEIVHNHYVVDQLRRRGAIFVDSEKEVPAGSVCVFSAHGVSPEVRASAKSRDLDVIDATCPLVSKVHQRAVRFAKSGRTLLLIGHANHEEIEGTYGEAPDRTIIIESVEDAEQVDLPPDAEVSFLTQTTLSIDDTRDIVGALRRRFKNLSGPPGSDICYASQNRQNAVKEIAPESDLILIVGSRNSSNSIRMVEVAKNSGTPAHLVPDVTELDESWLDGVSTVGVSSGASAPEILVEQLLDRLAELGYADVATTTTVEEDVVFTPPARLTQRVSEK